MELHSNIAQNIKELESSLLYQPARVGGVLAPTMAPRVKALRQEI